MNLLRFPLFFYLVRNGFVFNPLAVVANSPIGKGFYTFSMCHSIEPFALVRPSIFPVTDTKTIVPSIFPRTLVTPAITKAVDTVTFTLAVAELALVDGTVGPRKFALTMSFVFLEHAIVDTSV